MSVGSRTMMRSDLVVVAVLLLVSDVSGAVRLLGCHSVNLVPSAESSVEYVFIATRKEDCTFVFEGPEDSKLDIEVRSISFPKRFSEIDNCRKSKLTIYNYADNKVILGKLVCNENEKANLLTRSNMGIVTSSLTDGSFSIKIQPKTNNDRTLSEMTPPNQMAEDFFLFGGSEAAREGFKPIAGGFRPSLPLPQSDRAPSHPGYPGRPTQIVDITYNATGHNFTIVSHKITTPAPGGGKPEATTPVENTTSAASLSSTTQSIKPTSSAKPISQSSTVVAQASATSSIEPGEEE